MVKVTKQGLSLEANSYPFLSRPLLKMYFFVRRKKMKLDLPHSLLPLVKSIKKRVGVLEFNFTLRVDIWH